ncbi:MULTISPECIES: ATP-dependent zinc metalloprotease FtsH [Clostridium]|uniref:ATP-dependent zinc metalloprotease FtsH n=1 Tax=Clostridium colicanis DSM 13634 TaxID=1121305 RepID=A0A151ALW3_9CLOT|nr:MULTISPECIES: ATP-dependent zinc metalloprotease FtsH [Clostridium]KYH28629.1 ATP-dependent zinc metalloprotease FtsH [Clostridium colicanis DSM 13634]MBE6045034.1 ATP-dependent metallopeptidase FtsH/Yme1/Tma family protein [Clostridium thermopalmarium]
MKKISSATAWIIVLVLVILASLALLETSKNAGVISYNQFKQYWNENKISRIQVNENRMTVVGELRDQNKTQFEATVPQELLIEDLMVKNPNPNVEVRFEPPTSMPVWINWMPTIILILMLVGFWFMIMQQSQGGGGNRGVMNFGKSRAKLANPDKQKVTFNDVAGADEEKAELEEIVDFLKNPRRYLEMGARIPKGVLLVGPPGTGKTLLAKAVAGEAGVPFFSISGSDFVEMFVGVGASRVRDLFEQAKKNSPCIIFIDEIDAVGRQRGAGLGGGHDEREQTLNQLLVEMDGFGINEGIILIAATNRPDILDRALLRPGRFDRQILVGAPDVKGREEILRVHVKNKPLSDEVDLKVLAKRTPGFVGADLENLMNEAALLAVRNNKKKIGMEELEEAVTRVIAGPEKKSRVIDEEDRKLTAYHEAGHAIVMKFSPHADPVHEISIIPRGMAGGYTMHLPEKDTAYTSKSKLKDEMVGLLGGRVAEQLIIGDISTGASNDIQRVSTIARKMVMQYGMSETLGTITFGSGHDEVFLGRDIAKTKDYSEEVAFQIDKEVKALVDEAYKKAEQILKINIDKLHAVAQALLEKEKISGEEFNAIVEGKTTISEEAVDLNKDENNEEI